MSAIVANYYRSYELPWHHAAADRRRFRPTWVGALLVVLAIALLLPLLPKPATDFDVPPPVPPRIAKLVLERQVPPPPPPPPRVETPPEEVVPAEVTPRRQRETQPTPGPDLDRTQAARKKAAQAGLLPFVDQLADLRDDFEVTPDKLKPTATSTGTVDGPPRAERSLIASKAGTLSGGINTAATSRGYGYGAGSLNGKGTTQVNVPSGGSGGGNAVRSSGSGTGKGGAGGRGSRSDEEIRLMFDRNKAAVFALYNRALRDQPELQGKVVLELDIAPSGEVTNCRIISSELANEELERKLTARVKLFRFQDLDVNPMTVRHTLDFFPA